MDITIGKVYYNRFYSYPVKVIVKSLFDNEIVVEHLSGKIDEYSHKIKYQVINVYDFNNQYLDSFEAIKNEQLLYKVEELKSFIEKKQKELEELKKEFKLPTVLNCRNCPSQIARLDNICTECGFQNYKEKV